jgi:DNA polymerase III epsilon subunit-like protein
MSSILKILVDIQCLVYCDFEEVGEAFPNSILKIELRKGIYIIDFKKDNISLKSIKYKIKTDNEDYLLEESLTNIYTKKKETKKRKEISEKNVLWINVGGNWRIMSVDNDILNSVAMKSWIDLPNSYNLLPMGQHRDPDIDACGYIPFNIGGTLMEDDLTGFFISGGTWGCLDKSGKVVIQPIYSRKVFFYNDQVASTYINGIFSGVINQFGEKSFAEFDSVLPVDEVVGYYDVSQQNKHGIVNKHGEFILPLNYLSFGYHTSKVIWAQDTLSKKWGLLRFDATIVLPFIYDNINKAEDGFFVCKNEKWGTVNLDGKVIVDTKYQIITKISKCYYNPSNPSAYEDLDYLYNNYSIVVLGNNYEGYKYGIVNTHFVKHFSSQTITIAFKEIIPCKYDAIYSKGGKHYSDDDLVEAATNQYGAPDGLFEITDVYFVLKREHMQCDGYDNKGNITYSFICDEFNSKYKILSQKYYLRNTKNEFDDSPYDILETIDFYDGTYFVKNIYPDDWDGYTSISPIEQVNVKHKVSFLIGKRDGKWCVFDNRESNTYDCKKNEASEYYCSYDNHRLTAILFSYNCDKIVEFGILHNGEYFAIVEIDNYKKLCIIEDSKIIYESDYFVEIQSSYKQFSLSCRIDVEKYLNIRELDNDYFIARLHTDKWQILKYDCICKSYGVDIFKSPEFDFIRFVDETEVEIHLYYKGRTLYNTMSTLCWDNMKPDRTRWKVSPYEERNCNWVAVYDFDKDKEGIVIEEHDKLSETEDHVYDGYNIVGKVAEEIIIPFKWDYARVFYSELNPIIVIGNYTGKKVGKFLGAANEIKCAILDTNKRPLSSFIFDGVSIGWSCQDLRLHIGNYGVDINIVKDDLIYAIPFFYYDTYNEEGCHLLGTPFKNIKLFIDTETTGLPLNDNLPYTDLKNWPYLVQVALIIEDDNYGILAKRNIILKPDGYTIPESATKIHGISNEIAVKNGEDRDKVISFLDLALYKSDIIIGHNVSFDLNVIKSEIIRIKGIENALFKKKKHIVIDTMKMGRNICKIPNLSFHTRLSLPNKYPKLDELYYKLFNKHFNNQHDAMADVQAAYDCYYELKRKSQ